MKLQNKFTVPVPVADAWEVLLDVEQIAPCLPGAVVETVQGDDVVGRVKVKLGPIAMTYRGVVTFVERDDTARRVVMSARAKEARGSGTATATITTTLEPTNGSTQVSVETELHITGKPAQFGRSVMQDVSGNLLQQFAAALAKQLESGELRGSASPSADESVTAAGSTSTAATASTAGSGRPSPEAVDLLDAAGLAVSRRALPVAGGLLVGVIVGWLLGSRSSRPAACPIHNVS